MRFILTRFRNEGPLDGPMTDSCDDPSVAKQARPIRFLIIVAGPVESAGWALFDDDAGAAPDRDEGKREKGA